jgi:hypothetical protein
MSDSDAIAFGLGSLADDFFFSIILLRRDDPRSRALDFLHAHCLEISAKAACYKLRIEDDSLNGHKLKNIYKLLAKHDPSISNVLPEDEHYLNYTKLWVPENLANDDDKKSTPRYILPRESSSKYELAYFIENTVNLKYGFTKLKSQVSVAQRIHSHINPEFLKLFNFCRKIYADANMDKRIKEKMHSAFGETEDTDRNIFELLDL